VGWIIFLIIVVFVIFILFAAVQASKPITSKTQDGIEAYRAAMKTYAVLIKDSGNKDLRASDVNEIFQPFKEHRKTLRSTAKQLERIASHIERTRNIKDVSMEECDRLLELAESVEKQAQATLDKIIFKDDEAEEKFTQIVDAISDIVDEIRDSIEDIELVVAEIENRPPRLAFEREELEERLFDPVSPVGAVYRILYKSMRNNLALWDISIYEKYEDDRFKAIVYKEDETISLTFHPNGIKRAIDLKTGKEIEDFSTLLKDIPLSKETEL